MIEIVKLHRETDLKWQELIVSLNMSAGEVRRQHFHLLTCT